MSLTSMFNSALGAIRTQATNFKSATTGKQLAIVGAAVQVAGMPFAYKRAQSRTAGEGYTRTAKVVGKTLGGTVYLGASYGKDLYDAYFGGHTTSTKAADKAIMAMIGDQEPTTELVEASARTATASSIMATKQTATEPALTPETGKHKTDKFNKTEKTKAAKNTAVAVEIITAPLQ